VCDDKKGRSIFDFGRGASAGPFADFVRRGRRGHMGPTEFLQGLQGGDDRRLRRLLEGTSQNPVLPTDIVEYQDRMEVIIDLPPGHDPPDVRMEDDDRTLAIEVTRLLKREEGSQYHRQDRGSGTGIMEFSVAAEDLDVTKIEATVAGGVLTVIILKRTPVTRQIPITPDSPEVDEAPANTPG